MGFLATKNISNGSMYLRFLFATLIILSTLNLTENLFANTIPSGMQYHGRIIKPNGFPLEDSGVTFTLTIYDPAKTCILRQETHVVNMSGTDGVFSIGVGSGAPTVASPANLFTDIFRNDLAALNCGTGGPGTIDMDAGDTRRLEVTFTDSSSTVTISPDHYIRSMPYALIANSVQGLGRDDILQVNTADNVTQSNLDDLFTGTNYATLTDIVAGNSAVYAKITDLPVTGGNLDMSVDGKDILVRDTPASGNSAVNKDYVDGLVTAGTTPTGVAGGDLGGTYPNPSVISIQGDAVSATNPNNGEALVWAGGTSYVPTPVLPLAGGTMTGDINLGTNDITNGGTVTAATIVGAAGDFVTLDVSTVSSFTGIATFNDTIDLSTNRITNVGSPSAATDAATRGYVDGLVGTGTIGTVNLANDSVTYEKLQDVTATNRLLGRASTGAGIVEEIVLGTGLSYTGTTLNVTGAPPTGTAGGSLAGSYPNPTIAADAITTAEIDDGTVAAADLAPAVADGLWTVGSGDVYRSTGNVGIGTASPSAMLDIEAIGWNLLELNSTTNDATITLKAGASTGYINKSLSSLQLNSDTSSAGISILNNGKVGIGLTSPGSMLSVSGGASFGIYDSTAAPTGGIIVSGNVGIGTPAPTAALHLRAGTTVANTAPLKFTSGTNLTTAENGAMEFDGSNLFITIGGARRTIASYASGGGSAYATVITTSDTTQSTSKDTGSLIIEGGAGIEKNLFAGGSITSATEVTAGTYVLAPTFYGSTASGGDLTIDSTSNGTKGDIILAPTGGFVGIGTTSPGAKLEVNAGASTTTPALKVLSAGYTTGGVGPLYGIQVDVTPHNQATAGYGIHSIYRPQGYFIPEYAIYGENMGNAYSSNQVGIYGKSTQTDVAGPGQSMGVVGVAAAGGANAGAVGRTYAGYFDNTATVGDRAYGLYVNSAPGANTVIPLAVAIGGTEVMRVSGSGNVGIGTTSPNRRLSVTGTSTGEDQRVAIFRVSSTGGYGFGGTLELRQNDTTVNNVTGVMGYNASGTAIAGIEFQNVNHGTVGSRAGQVSLFSVGTGDVTHRMVMNESGKVGIGVTDPQAKLHVDGAIVGKAVSISSSPIDFSTGNIQYTTNNCGAFRLDNLKDGGSYSFVVKGATSATCSFTAFTGVNTGALTVHMPIGHTATTASKHTVYSFFVAGSDVYFAWVPGL